MTSEKLNVESLPATHAIMMVTGRASPVGTRFLRRLSRERRLSAPISCEISLEHSRPCDDLPSVAGSIVLPLTLDFLLFDEIEIRRMAITTTIYLSSLAKMRSFMTLHVPAPEMCRR